MITIVVLSFFFLLLIAISYYATLTGPTFVNKYEQLVSSAEIERIQKIGHLDVNQDFFVKIPEFSMREREESWWKQHQQIYTLLKNHTIIDIEMPEATKYKIKFPDFYFVFKQLGMLYFVSFILLLNSLYLAYYHQSLTSYLLAIGIASSALYYISAGTVSLRSITLSPIMLKTLVWISYISSAGLITIVHYSFVFPKLKITGLTGRILFTSMYGSMTLVIILYFTAKVAYGTSVPLPIFWTLIMSASFLHSYFCEIDKVLKKSLLLVVIMPIFTGGIFSFLNVLANAFAMSPLPITQQILFSLAASITLTLSFVQVYEYDKELNNLRKQSSEKQILPHFLEQLTPRQRNILEKFVHGDTLQDIAKELCIAYSTVRTHIQTLYPKFGVHSERELVALVTGIRLNK